MEIPQKVIDGGVLRVFLDTPIELEKAVKEYNKEMREYKPKMRLIHQIETGFLILNPLVAVTIYINSLMTAVMFDDPFISPALMTALMVISLAVYATLGLYKHYLFTVALSNAPLLLFSWLPAAILIGVDVGFLIWYYKVLEPLKNKRGYPDFRTIEITYSKTYEPRDKTKG